MNEFGVVFVEAAFVVFELNGTSMAQMHVIFTSISYCSTTIYEVISSKNYFEVTPSRRVT